MQSADHMSVSTEVPLSRGDGKWLWWLGGAAAALTATGLLISHQRKKDAEACQREEAERKAALERQQLMADFARLLALRKSHRDQLRHLIYSLTSKDIIKKCKAPHPCVEKGWFPTDYLPLISALFKQAQASLDPACAATCLWLNALSDQTLQLLEMDNERALNTARTALMARNSFILTTTFKVRRPGKNDSAHAVYITFSAVEGGYTATVCNLGKGVNAHHESIGDPKMFLPKRYLFGSLADCLSYFEACRTTPDMYQDAALSTLYPDRLPVREWLPGEAVQMRAQKTGNCAVKNHLLALQQLARDNGQQDNFVRCYQVMLEKANEEFLHYGGKADELPAAARVCRATYAGKLPVPPWQGCDWISDVGLPGPTMPWQSPWGEGAYTPFDFSNATQVTPWYSQWNADPFCLDYDESFCALCSGGGGAG